MTAPFFITATGTGMGKTLVTTALCWQLQQRGKQVAALKPVVSGFDPKDLDSDPAVILRSLGLVPAPEMIKTISPWQFSAPLAPPMAARKEMKFIVFEEVVEFCEEHASLQTDILLTEGVGGVMAPLDDRHTVLDLIGRLKWPVMLVAGSYVGSISHTLTALDVLESRGAEVAAVILSESEKSDASLGETAEGLSSFVSKNIPIVKLPRMQPQMELWKQMPNISWLCQEPVEHKAYDA